MLRSKRQDVVTPNPSPSAVKRPLVLLVENDENVRLIVRTVATTIGFGFVAGISGEEGLALAREYDPDLILSDAMMPVLKEAAHGKAVIITGLDAGEALERFKADDCMAKPVAVDDILRVFRKHLPQETQQTM